MRVIDIYANDDITSDFEARARDLGHRVSTSDGARNALRVVVENGAPDEFLENLRERMDTDDEQFYVVFEPVAIAPRIEQEADDDSWTATTDEIESFVIEGARLTRVYILMSAIAGILATIGLLRGSPAVLVGAMVLAPVFKPMASAGAGALLGRVREALTGLALLAGSLAVAAIAGGAVTLLTPDPAITHALEIRASISPFDIIIALCSGVAMGYTLMHRDAMSMVGIVVAASLVPVAAAMGVALSLLDFGMVLGAAVTLTSNIAGILVGLIATCQFEQLRVSRLDKDSKDGRRLATKGLAFGAVCLLLLIGANIWNEFAKDPNTSGETSKLVTALTDVPGVRWVEIQPEGPALIYTTQSAIDANVIDQLNAITKNASFEQGIIIVPTQP